mmetsp:Transcript_10152/g.17268  ORF Transcript_10152/g.17268 Transcript_10152/m.17268 type:complete len:186 (-) Transcript_10152:7-564(-)
MDRPQSDVSDVESEPEEKRESEVEPVDEKKDSDNDSEEEAEVHHDKQKENESDHEQDAPHDQERSEPKEAEPVVVQEPPKPVEAPLSDAEEQARANARARDYIKLAKDLLSKDDFRMFQTALKDYKTKKLSLEDLIDQIGRMFCTNETVVLLDGFSTFIPNPKKNMYSDFCETIKIKHNLSSPEE